MEHYTTKDLEAPIREYLETDKSQYQIAREYGIPRSTLNDHIRRLFGHVDEDMGRRALGLPSPRSSRTSPNCSLWLIRTCPTGRPR